ncbi:DUF2057 family protein [Solimonas variicoloris]|uniref:DUF2057 family protein n=1 Tax=Solimonas variicoloris TaxID=254408 RepID=UPI00146EDF81|nr:DUF2057 family protein [Solimonas variicoloris]
MFRFAKFLAPALLLSLAACASPQLRLYEGTAKPAAEVAVITMPEQLEVASINGTEVPGAKGMWNKGDKRLEVLPGRYEALIYYREVWQSGDSSDVLRSRSPALFVIDAQAGHQYRIGYSQPANYEAAKRLAQDFRGWVDDQTSATRTASVDSGVKFKEGVLAQVSGDGGLVADHGAEGPRAVQPVRPLPPAPAVAPVAPPVPAVAVPSAAASAAAASAAPVAGAAGRDWVSLMKGWWQQASADERRGFLRWVGGEAGKTVAGGDWLETIKTWWAQSGDGQRREFLRWVGEQP